MSARKIRLPGMVAFLVVSLLVLTTRFGPVQLAHAQTSWPTHYFAPYNFDPSHQTDLVALSHKTGTKFFTLAFIINDKLKACQASWNAIQPIGSWMQSRISALQAAGGDVSASFGGASGKEVADSCTTISSLEAQYQSVITTYNLTHLDFDIEGKTLSDTKGNDRRNKAIAALQAANSQLVVSYTLSVNVTSLPQPEINLLQNAIKAANSTYKQLHALYPSKSASELWEMLGLTPMIGMNDDHKEIFTLDDAQTVLNFAQQQNITLLSFWDVQRDHQCDHGQKPPNNCTGVKQEPYQYDQTFAPFTGMM